MGLLLPIHLKPQTCMGHLDSADGEGTAEALVTTGQALKNLVMAKAALKQASTWPASGTELASAEPSPAIAPDQHMLAGIAGRQ